MHNVAIHDACYTARRFCCGCCLDFDDFCHIHWFWVVVNENSNRKSYQPYEYNDVPNFWHITPSKEALGYRRFR